MHGGDHVYFVRLTLGALAVKELVNRLIGGLLLKNHLRDLKQGFTQQWKSALGNASGISVELPRLIRRRVNTCNRYERF